MSVYELGYLIRDIRIKRGITQKQLCEGICSQKDLSEIENGRQLPRDCKFELIMQRLGLCPENYLSIFLGAKDYESYQKLTELDDLLIYHEYDKAEQMVLEMEKDERYKKSYDLQRLFNARASIYCLRDGNNKEAMEMSDMAIKLTIPKFDETQINKYLLTYEEVVALNVRAIIYGLQGSKEKAIEVLYAVKESMDRSYYEEQEKAKMYLGIMSTLSKYLGLSQRYEEAIEICRLGKEICSRTNKYFVYPKLTYNELWCLHRLGRIEQCKSLIPIAYYGFMMSNQYEDLELLKNYAKRDFDIVF